MKTCPAEQATNYLSGGVGVDFKNLGKPSAFPRDACVFEVLNLQKLGKWLRFWRKGSQIIGQLSNFQQACNCRRGLSWRWTRPSREAGYYTKKVTNDNPQLGWG